MENDTLRTSQIKKLDTFLLNKIRSKDNADEIVDTFYVLYGRLPSYDLYRHVLLFLRAATEDDHTELRVLLLANTRHGDPSFVARNDERSEVHTSVTESDHEIVRLLLSVDVLQKQEGVRRLLSADPTTFKPEHGRMNPLECFAGLGRLFYKRQLSLALPEIVLLLIDAGADVFQQSSSGAMPLDRLMDELEHMKTDDVELAREGRHTILETTQILLEAGSKMAGQYSQRPVDRLLEVYVNSSNWPRLLTNSLQYKLISALLELLLTHIEMTTATEDYDELFIVASMIAWNFEYVRDKPGFLEHYNSILESFANILRCVIISTRDIGCPDALCFTGFTDDWSAWSVMYVYVTLSASQPGRTSELVRLVLNTLRASHVVKLRKHLMNRVKLAQEVPQTGLTSSVVSLFKADWNDMLEWIDKVELPFRLENLASRAVTRAMSTGVLRKVSRLGLPHRIERFLLLKFD